MSVYSPNYYANQEDGSVASAEAIVPIVLSLVPAKKVIDIGCGVGTWLSVFAKHGVAILGVDGTWVKPEQLHIPADNFHPADLEHLAVREQADMAVCMEVAEHLPGSAAAQLVAGLTAIAPVVLFSAAIPYQGGTHHVNEQWPAYWAELFAKHGYVPVDAIRRRVWDNPAVEYWYAQNAFIFVKKSDLGNYPLLAAEIDAGFDTALALVHPRKFLYVAERYRLIAPLIAMLPGGMIRSAKRTLQKFL